MSKEDDYKAGVSRGIERATAQEKEGPVANLISDMINSAEDAADEYFTSSSYQAGKTAGERLVREKD